MSVIPLTWGDLITSTYGLVSPSKIEILEYIKDSTECPEMSGYYQLGESIRVNTNITLKEIADYLNTPLFEYDEKCAIGNKAYAAMVRGLEKLVVDLGSKRSSEVKNCLTSQPKEKSVWAKRQETKKLEHAGSVTNLLK